MEQGNFNINQMFKDGWKLFTGNIQTLLISMLLMIAVYIAASLIPLIGNILPTILSGPLAAGFILIIFKVSKGETPPQSTLFSFLQTGYAFQLILASVISGILTTIGILLLIIPGIYLAVSYTFLFYIMASKEMDFWTAMEFSRKIVWKNFGNILLLLLAILILNIGGTLLLGVGLLITMPLSSCILFFAFKESMKGESLERIEQ